MATADNPSNAIFNEDEDLLDDDDDDESEDDSASSAGAALPPPATLDRPTSSQVTIAFPGLPDLHPKQNQPDTVAPKKPPQPDESRKLFQRLWTDEDEIELLQGFLDYNAQRGGPHNSSHHHDTAAFYDQIRSKFQLDFNKNQLVEKLRRLKKKYRNVINKFGSGKDYAFKSPHDQATFEISSKIWGSSAVNGSSSAVRPAPVDEDDDDPGNPHSIDFLNGLDVNSKTPRPRKRNRAGGVKVESKQHLSVNNTACDNQPLAPVTPVVAPVSGTGSMSAVIEETVKSCLSPIFKELLGNSMTSNLNHNNNGLFGGHGFGLALSPLPLGFPGAMGGDKMTDDKWRKQQILELEVFSKRLELVQDQISAQLQELRSMGN